MQSSISLFFSLYFSFAISVFIVLILHSHILIVVYIVREQSSDNDNRPAGRYLRDVCARFIIHLPGPRAGRVGGRCRKPGERAWKLPSKHSHTHTH